MNTLQVAIAAKGIAAAKQYAEDVKSGKVLACQWVKLAVARNDQDLATGHERGLYFDENAAARIIITFSYLRHYKGQWKGRQLVLEPWQLWIVYVVFGWKRCRKRRIQENGQEKQVFDSPNPSRDARRFSRVYEEVARKNGKTFKLAGIAVHAALKDREGAPDVFTAATSRDQARLLFKDIGKLIGYSPQFRRHFHRYKDRYEGKGNDAEIRPLSKEANSLDGLNPHFALIDELHAHKTPEVYEVLESALGARYQPLLWVITTAGFNTAGICYEKRDYTCKVLQGVYQDDSHFGIIYTLDDWENEWKDPLCWVKSNPNIQYLTTNSKGVEVVRGSVDPEKLQTEVDKAINSPAALTNTLTKHFNIWIGGETLWTNIETWKQRSQSYTLDDFEDAIEVYAALDLSATSDLTSLVLVGVFEDGSWRCWCRNYVPDAAVHGAVKKRAVPYDAWVREGWLIATPGNVVDYNFIEHDAKEIHQRLNMICIAYDRWNATQVVNNLTDEGLEMLAFGQGYASMSPAMKELERRYLSEGDSSQRLYHPNDPVLNWAMSNLVAHTDPAGNIKPAKDKCSEKIDPAVALIMACGAALSLHEEQYESAYSNKVFI